MHFVNHTAVWDIYLGM